MGCGSKLADQVFGKVLMGDGLPQNICFICVEKLQAAYSFKKQCQIVDLKYKSIVDGLKHIADEVVKTDPLKHNNGDTNQMAYEKSAIEYEAISIDYNTNPIEYDINFMNYSTGDLDNHVESDTEPGVQITKKARGKSYERIDTCQVCNNEFTPSKLKLHMRIHTKERPYKCDFCGQHFSFSSNLQRYLRTHTGERPHKCQLCNKEFTQSTSLINHVRIHTGERPFPCKLCSMSFTSTQTRKNHLRIHLRNNSRMCRYNGEKGKLEHSRVRRRI